MARVRYRDRSPERVPVGSRYPLVTSADWKSAIRQTGSLSYAFRLEKAVKYPGQGQDETPRHTPRAVETPCIRHNHARVCRTRASLDRCAWRVKSGLE